MNDLNVIPRTCATCACSDVQKDQTNPLVSQMFCRRDPPMAQQMRVELPVIRDGKPVMQKNDPTKPLTTAGVQMAYMYKPTLANLTCFDGWRPMGAEPGRAMDSADSILAIMKKLHTDLMVQSLENVPDLGDLDGTHLSLDGTVQHDGSRDTCATCTLEIEAKKA
jgi:hypothetical protein